QEAPRRPPMRAAPPWLVGSSGDRTAFRLPRQVAGFDRVTGSPLGWVFQGVAPVKSIGAVAVPLGRVEPAIAAPSLRIDQLLERLPSGAGTKLADQLFARVAANLQGEGQLE